MRLLEFRDFSLSTAREGLELLDRVSFSMEEGEILGLVGESGCGKSMTALSAMRLHAAGELTSSGQIFLEGRELTACTEREMESIRGKDISMIFQEPMVSLNPSYSVGFQLTEMIRLHQKVAKKAALARAEELLETVAIPAPREMLRRYPHELSGGMRQRVMIAMAIANQPRLLIADEPTTALDVTIQIQILEMLRQLRDDTGMGVLLITHDLGVVAEICDRVAIMYAGRIVEEAPAADIFSGPQHPYTAALLRSLPKMQGSAPRLAVIPGQVPAPQDYIRAGCRFAPRCERAKGRCFTAVPPRKKMGEAHFTGCFSPEGEGYAASES